MQAVADGLETCRQQGARQMPDGVKAPAPGFARPPRYGLSLYLVAIVTGVCVCGGGGGQPDGARPAARRAALPTPRNPASHRPGSHLPRAAPPCP